MGFEYKAEEMLKRHYWPGNIRELKNCVERAVLFAEEEFVSLADLGLEKPEEPEKQTSKSIPDFVIPEEGIHLEEVERSLIIQALEASGWVQKKAAGLLNISPRVLNYKIKRFEITHEKWIVNSPCRNEYRIVMPCIIPFRYRNFRSPEEGLNIKEDWYEFCCVDCIREGYNEK